MSENQGFPESRHAAFPISESNTAESPGHAHEHEHAHAHAHAADGDACAPPAAARTVSEQLAAVLDTCRALRPVQIPLDAARGLVLAEDVTTATDTPPFDNSAMDGYAVQRGDLLSASASQPITLPVVADLAAGTAQNPRLEPGQSARIMTGAPIPDGADAIVPIEDTDQGTEQVTIFRPPAVHAHIRRAGEDARAGDIVLRTGAVLWPTRVAASASAGRSSVLAYPAPRVAVVSTGSELVAPGDATRRGQIPDSNSFLLAAAVAEAGCIPIRVGAVPDDERTLRELLASLAETVDAIVLSGGVSVGAYDVVKAVLAPLGTVRFGPVKMQPGKPQGFGRWPSPVPDEGSDITEFPASADLPPAALSVASEEPTAENPLGPVIFALPGNPVSAYVSFEVFVRPALRQMMGHRQLQRPTVTATVTAGWRSPTGRAQFMPVIVELDGERQVVRPAAAGGSGSHLVAGLGQSNGLALAPEDTTQINVGDLVTVMLTT